MCRLKVVRGLDIHERVPHGKDFDCALLGAVVNPVAVMPTENLAQFRAVKFGECNPPDARIAGKLPYCFEHFVFEQSSVVGVKAGL